MTIIYDTLRNWPIAPVEQTFSKRDTMLYALGIGLGADPLDTHQLKFVYEENLLALPTMAITLGYPGAWFAHPDTGITRPTPCTANKVSSSINRCRSKAASSAATASPT